MRLEMANPMEDQSLAQSLDGARGTHFHAHAAAKAATLVDFEGATGLDALRGTRFGACAATGACVRDSESAVAPLGTAE